MAISILHAQQTVLPDGGNPLLIQPSNWNEEHVLTMAADRLLGRSLSFPATGDIAELTISASLSIAGGVLSFGDDVTLAGVDIETPLAISMGGHGATTANQALINLGLELCGNVFFFPLSSAPAGFLKANGAAVSRTTYANLFAKIGTSYGAGNGSTTFNVPDLRGYFVRGLDDGRGVDTDRALNTIQASSVDPHTHTFSGNVVAGGEHTHGAFDISGISGSGNSNLRSLATNANFQGGARSTDGVGSHSHSFSGNTSGNSGGISETRPRNVALLACVKY